MSKGIDIAIDGFISTLNTYLWTLNTRAFYGRVFRDEYLSDDGIKVRPLYYANVNSEPIDVLFSDTNHAQCFCDVMPDREMSALVKIAEVRLMFMVNLAAIYPLLKRTEAIEQILRDVEKYIPASQFKFIKMVSGYTAFNDYNWSESALADMKDNYLFRFDLKLVYNN